MNMELSKKASTQYCYSERFYMGQYRMQWRVNSRVVMHASIYLTTAYFTVPTVEEECRPVMSLLSWKAGCLRSMVRLKPEDMVGLLPQIFNRIMMWSRLNYALTNTKDLMLHSFTRSEQFLFKNHKISTISL